LTDPAELYINPFNPTRVRLKPDKPCNSLSTIFAFNPTRVRLKLIGMGFEKYTDSPSTPQGFG